MTNGRIRGSDRNGRIRGSDRSRRIRGIDRSRVAASAGRGRSDVALWAKVFIYIKGKKENCDKSAMIEIGHIRRSLRGENLS